jgi:hypothetical protein
MVLTILFLLFQVMHYLFINNVRIDSIAIGVESILIFVYIFFFFMDNLNSPKDGFIYTNHTFWISVGLLIYLGGSFFINILANSLSKEEFERYWYLNYIADTVKTLFFATALIINNKKLDSKIRSKPKTIPYLDLT